MSKMNLMVHLNGYEDLCASNNPAKNNFKWSFDVKGIEITEPCSKFIKIKDGESVSLFSGDVAITDDNTTEYDITLKAGTSNTYKIEHSGGQLPNFRGLRGIGGAADTEVTVTKNGPVVKYESTGGTLFDFTNAGVQVGDEVRLGAGFNLSNQGKFKVISFDSTSVSVENESGVAEGPIVLGASFNSVFLVYPSSGVQVGDKVELSSGFSPISLGIYEITDVAPDYIEIYSGSVLPEETSVQTQLKIYSSSKKVIYVETNHKLKIQIDGLDAGNIEPLSFGSKLISGMYLKSGESYSATLTNNSGKEASVFYVLAE